MNRSRITCGMVTGAILLLSRGVLALNPEADAILKMIPSDMGMAGLVLSFDQLDKNVSAFMKSMDPKNEGAGLITKIKEELAMGGLVDFTKPVGLAQANVMGGSNNVVWAYAPGFAEKVKALSTAKEDAGVWHLTPENKDEMFCVVKGDIVIGGTSKDVLDKALKVERSMADELKDRINLFDDRAFMLHFNFEPVRPMALQGIQQAAMFAPMLAGMAAQTGLDPGGVSAVITGLLDGVRKFLEQLAYLEFLGNMGTAYADATLAVGFKEGGIKSYLQNQKPAAIGLLAENEDQPYMLAMASHFPGKDSPFFDWFFDKVGAMATPAATAPGSPGAALKDSLANTRELYRKVEGWSLVMSVSPAGMRMSGDYVGPDAPGILDLAKKGLVQTTPLSKAMSGGMAYEASGSKKIGDATVEEFAIKFDPNDPKTAEAAKLMGENARMAMGVVGNRVRYFLGAEADATKAFNAKVEKPLVGSTAAAEVVKGLPAKKNVLILVDLTNILSMVGAMTGQAAPAAVPPGPPAAISISLSGEPARIDVHMPLKSLEAIVKASNSQPAPGN